MILRGYTKGRDCQECLSADQDFRCYSPRIPFTGGSAIGHYLSHQLNWRNCSRSLTEYRGRVLNLTNPARSKSFEHTKTRPCSLVNSVGCLPLMNIPDKPSAGHSKPAYPSYPQPHKSKTQMPHKSVPQPQFEENAAIHAIQCWMYDGSQPPDTGCDEISESDIESWFRQPCLRSSDNKPASAGLRLLYRQQQTSWTLPFETSTLEKINKILGLPEAHAYLNTYGAGVCGHYLENPNQPGVSEPA